MALSKDRRIGKHAILLLLSEDSNEHLAMLKQLNWKSCTGKVGAMDTHKVVAAIETAAKKNGVINPDLYRESHALYHAIIEALNGITRGQVQLGSVLRTVGLSFSYGFPRKTANDKPTVLSTDPNCSFTWKPI